MGHNRRDSASGADHTQTKLPPGRSRMPKPAIVSQRCKFADKAVSQMAHAQYESDSFMHMFCTVLHIDAHLWNVAKSKRFPFIGTQRMNGQRCTFFRQKIFREISSGIREKICMSFKHFKTEWVSRNLPRESEAHDIYWQKVTEKGVHSLEYLFSQTERELTEENSRGRIMTTSYCE